MENNIRKATINDIEDLKKIEELNFDKTIRENFEFVINSPSHLYLVAENEEKNVVAYAGASISYEQGDLLCVCVKDEYRRKGYATKLLNELFSCMKKLGVCEVFLEVEEFNTNAQNLYKKLNFEVLSKRKNYYGYKTAIIMVKQL